MALSEKKTSKQQSYLFTVPYIIDKQAPIYPQKNKIPTIFSLFCIILWQYSSNYTINLKNSKRFFHYLCPNRNIIYPHSTLSISLNPFSHRNSLCTYSKIRKNIYIPPRMNPPLRQRRTLLFTFFCKNGNIVFMDNILSHKKYCFLLLSKLY